MTQQQQLPLTRPPLASEKTQENITTIIPQITQKRMATLNRFNKVFAVLGLLFLAMSLFFYLSWNQDKILWEEDKKKIANYEKFFDQFPQTNTLTVKNRSGKKLMISDLNITYTPIDKDTIISIVIDVGSNIDKDSLLTIEDGESHYFDVLDNKQLDHNIQLLFCGIMVWEDECSPLFLSKPVPKNGCIRL